MARVTLDLNPAVLRALETRSREEHRPMGDIASELLTAALQQTPATGPEPFRWASSDMGKPLVDLYDREQMRQALDGD